MQSEITAYRFPSQAYTAAPAAYASAPTATGMIPSISDKLTTALNGIQLASNLAADPTVDPTVEPFSISPVWQVASAISSTLCIYHGYKRNKSVGWAIWWGLMGGIAPVIAPVIAVAQGFGKERQK